jgi:hypothetical protein
VATPAISDFYNNICQQQTLNYVPVLMLFLLYSKVGSRRLSRPGGI